MKRVCVCEVRVFLYLSYGLALSSVHCISFRNGILIVKLFPSLLLRKFPIVFGMCLFVCEERRSMLKWTENVNCDDENKVLLKKLFFLRLVLFDVSKEEIFSVLLYCLIALSKFASWVVSSSHMDDFSSSSSLIKWDFFGSCM